MKNITLAIVIAVFLLVSGSYLYLGTQARRIDGWKRNVRGSALVAGGLTYTLNYTQQQELLTILNKSKKVRAPKSSYKPGTIESILIYHFNKEDPLELIPAAYDLSLFKVNSHYIQIHQPKDLKILLELAYNK